jgi:metal-dependent amidase/aminoacylase/carboxypeptidase family protein
MIAWDQLRVFGSAHASSSEMRIAWTCRSEHDGQGHMCGHDGHMAMLLGGARLLHDAESSLKVQLDKARPACKINDK